MTCETKTSRTFPDFPQNTPESRGEFSDFHSVLRLRPLGYWLSKPAQYLGGKSADELIHSL